MKGFLDEKRTFATLALMKNLLKLGVLVVVSGLFSSCGIPMATVRTVQNTAKTLVSTAGNPLGY